MYKVRLLQPLELDDNDLRLVVALAIRPGLARSESELGQILWGERSWQYDPRPERLRPPITRARKHIDIPNKPRGGSSYKANLLRTEVDLTDFVDRSTSAAIDPTEVDSLLGLWRHDPEAVFDFLPPSDFNALTRARRAFIAKLSDWSQVELAQLSNLEQFRTLFEEECENLASPTMHQEKRLLIVDDNAGLTSMLVGLLGGFETVIAYSAEEAIAIITDPHARLDGALVDLHLTDRGNDNQGIAVLDTLRYQRPAVPRVLMTSSPPPEAISKFNERYGLFELLVKNGPDAPAHTRRTVEEMLSDNPEHAIERARTTFRTLASRVEQYATQAVIAATRRQKTGDASHGESLTAALERLEFVDSEVKRMTRALEESKTPTQAQEVVSECEKVFKEYLADGGLQ